MTLKDCFIRKCEENNIDTSKFEHLESVKNNAEIVDWIENYVDTSQYEHLEGMKYDAEALRWTENHDGVDYKIIVTFETISENCDITVGIFVYREKIMNSEDAMKNLLVQLNNFNSKYLMATFFYDEDGINMRSCYEPVEGNEEEDAYNILVATYALLSCAYDTIGLI